MTKLPQRVIVTAGASGIGLAIAQKFLAEGARVFICDVSAVTLETALVDNRGLQDAVADICYLEGSGSYCLFLYTLQCSERYSYDSKKMIKPGR